MVPLRRHAGHTGIFGNTTVAQLPHRLPNSAGACRGSVDITMLDECNNVTAHSFG